MPFFGGCRCCRPPIDWSPFSRRERVMICVKVAAFALGVPFLVALALAAVWPAWLALAWALGLPPA